MVPSRVLVLIMAVKRKHLGLLLFYMLIFSDDLVKNDFKGFHNWYQFLIEQQAGQISNVAYGTFQGSTQVSYF